MKMKRGPNRFYFYFFMKKKMKNREMGQRWPKSWVERERERGDGDEERTEQFFFWVFLKKKKMKNREMGWGCV